MTGAIIQTEGGASGWPGRLLRLEGLALLVVTCVLYEGTGLSWWWFAGLFLVPDLAFLAYGLGRGAGTLAYNLTHTEIGPAVLGLIGMTVLPAALPFALIWAAHIGWDRMIGYGLKYASSFDHTHLGPVGRAAKASRAAA
ncbi:hypothetical protein IP78_07600 [Brevundimonas sp. AAP58]|uniref:DUF4260 domain-containing protein n=1 Tax=Brevundimonas sp. AAP58 TaxID=1523422 RepID=UPI0006B99DC5|nr:DUF4260 domain-containing protein [Brevundimonas sp. AAP58]KPF80142.1 hypothetical protein IP78_07600 [Brevundimonas sp. AAP58]